MAEIIAEVEFESSDRVSCVTFGQPPVRTTRLPPNDVRITRYIAEGDLVPYVYEAIENIFVLKNLVHFSNFHIGKTIFISSNRFSSNVQKTKVPALNIDTCFNEIINHVQTHLHGYKNGFMEGVDFSQYAAVSKSDRFRTIQFANGFDIRETKLKLQKDGPEKKLHLVLYPIPREWKHQTFREFWYTSPSASSIVPVEGKISSFGSNNTETGIRFEVPRNRGIDTASEGQASQYDISFFFYDGLVTLKFSKVLFLHNIWFIGNPGAGKTTILSAMEHLITNPNWKEDSDEMSKEMDWKKFQGKAVREPASNSKIYSHGNYRFVEFLGAAGHDVSQLDRQLANHETEPAQVVIVVSTQQRLVPGDAVLHFYKYLFGQSKIKDLNFIKVYLVISDCERHPFIEDFEKQLKTTFAKELGGKNKFDRTFHVNAITNEFTPRVSGVKLLLHTLRGHQPTLEDKFDQHYQILGGVGLIGAGLWIAQSCVMGVCQVWAAAANGLGFLAVVPAMYEYLKENKYLIFGKETVEIKKCSSDDDFI